MVWCRSRLNTARYAMINIISPYSHFEFGPPQPTPLGLAEAKPVTATGYFVV